MEVGKCVVGRWSPTVMSGRETKYCFISTITQNLIDKKVVYSGIANQ